MSPFLLPLPFALLTSCTKSDEAADSGRAEDSGSVADSGSNQDSGDVVIDEDGDGFSADADCDDANAEIHPDAVEVCNGIDDNCDDVVDTDATDQGTWYGDGDGDGFGTPDEAVTACDQPSDTVEDATDCDDALSEVFPGADEVCGDGLVNDCDGTEEDALAACPPSWPDSLADADVKWSAEQAWASGGRSVDVGDVDGDGLDDVLVGVSGRSNANENSGRAYLMLGGTLASGTFESAADRSYSPTWSWQTFAQGVEIAPDMDGDGTGEVVVGTTDSETGGRVYTFLGSADGALEADDAVSSIYSSPSDGSFGQAIASGDFDGDGVGDLLLGSPGANDGETIQGGGAYVFLGPVTGTESTWSSDGRMTHDRNATLQTGRDVANAGDTDGDGIDDLLVGAPYWSITEGTSHVGATYLLLGGTASSAYNDLDDSYDARISGSEQYEYVGYSIAGGGDVDGDGHDDVLVGAWGDAGSGEYQAGEVYVFLGGVTGDVTDAEADATLVGSADRGWAGREVAAAGDMDGDGLGDILVGAPADYESEDLTGGVTYLVLGGVSGTVALDDAFETTSGEVGSDGAGMALASGDVNGDGRPDTVIGAPYQNAEGTTNTGAAYLLINDGGY